MMGCRAFFIEQHTLQVRQEFLVYGRLARCAAGFDSGQSACRAESFASDFAAGVGAGDFFFRFEVRGALAGLGEERFRQVGELRGEFLRMGWEEDGEELLDG
jgi:hypothetical protein